MSAIKKLIPNVNGPEIDRELRQDKEILGTPNREWKKPYTQQGDCILAKAVPGAEKYFYSAYTSIPKDVVELKENLILKGNTNSHALYGGSFSLYKLEDTNQLFVRVYEPCVLAHVKDLKTLKRAEHNGQWIPKGDYFFKGLLETDHINKLERQVVD